MKTIMKPPPPAKGRIAKASLLLLTLTLLILSACAKQELPEPENPKPMITKSYYYYTCCPEAQLYFGRCPEDYGFNPLINGCEIPYQGEYLSPFYAFCGGCGAYFESDGADWYDSHNDGYHMSDLVRFALLLRTSGQEEATGSAFIPGRISKLNVSWYTGTLFSHISVFHDTCGEKVYTDDWSLITGGGSFTISPQMTNTWGHFGFYTASSGGGSCSINE